MQALIDKLFEAGKKKGFTDQEVFYQSNKSLSIQVYKGEIEKYDTSLTGGLSYRGIANGKMGYVFTELLDESVIEKMVNDAYDSAQAIESKDEVFIFGEKMEYANPESFCQALAETPMDQKIAVVTAFEKAARGMDERVVDILHCTYNESETESFISNTSGLFLSNKTNYAAMYAMAMVKDGEGVRTHYDAVFSRDFVDFDPEKTARKLVDGCLEKIGASLVKSKDYKVVLHKDAFTSLLGAHIGMLMAETVQKDMSPFKNRVGEKIAVEGLTIVDDPLYGPALKKYGYDDEGYPSSATTIVEGGVLKSFLYNLKTAKKDGVRSTGNARRGSYKGTVGTDTTNIVVSPGSLNLEAMIAKCGEGILITEVSGLHAGINAISGDFSLMAEGFTIENGKKGRPITQIVVSGNFYEMLKHIEEIGSDNGPHWMAVDYFVPSILVASLTVSGE